MTTATELLEALETTVGMLEDDAPRYGAEDLAPFKALVAKAKGETVKAGTPFGRRASDSLHWNPADSLPPVDCPLLVLVEGMTVRVERPYFAERKGDQLEYRKTDGTAIFGRFPWTYP